MSNDPGYEVLFLPWADLATKYTFGPFEFTPWNQISTMDADVKEYLSRYFAQHVDHRGKSISDVVVLYHPKHGFTPAAYPNHERPQWAMYAISFAVIAPRVLGALSSGSPEAQCPASNRYDVYRQNFRAGDRHIRVRSGHGDTLVELSVVTFQEPWGLGVTKCTPDNSLLDSLGTMLAPSYPALDRERIFRALEWFHLAHASSDAITDFSRVVMMATAFEVLFQIPDGPGKTKHFISAVESRLVTPKTRKDKRMVEVKAGKKKGTKKPVTHSLPGWWADKFYDLRSRIVHGDELVLEQLQYKNSITNFTVAELVLTQCIVQELAGASKADAKWTATWSTMVYESHRALDWAA